VETAVALRPGDANVLYNAACCYAILEQKPEAIATLQKAFDAGYGNREWVARDPDFTSVKSDPEFQRLIQPR
jgi:non-specific serine/threonine protein kinase